MTRTELNKGRAASDWISLGVCYLVLLAMIAACILTGLRSCAELPLPQGGHFVQDLRDYSAKNAAKWLNGGDE